MADRERSRNDESPTDKTPKSRGELDHLLQRIAAHIAETEKREAAAGPLREPMSEASAGDTEAASPRTRAELPKAPAAAARPPIDSRPDMDADADDGRFEVTDDADFPDETPAQQAMRRMPSAVEPPALRSALPNQPKVSGAGSPPRSIRRAEALKSAGAGESAVTPERQLPVEPPVALEKPLAAPAAAAARKPPVAVDQAARTADASHEDDWSPENAEALTRSYDEAATAVPPLRSMLGVMAGRPAPAGSPAGDDRDPDAEAAMHRLLEAARRVEASLERLAPRAAVEAFDQRFVHLEGEVAKVGTHLARLDGIEERLGVLGDKLSDEQVVALFGTLVPTAEDLAQLAEDAAGRAADRVLEAYASQLADKEPAGSAAVVDPTAGKQLEALSQIVASFIDERRRTDAGTLDALETLQLAMQHMLDRLDQFETGAPLDEPDTASEAGVPAAAPAMPLAAATPQHRTAAVSAPQAPSRIPVAPASAPSAASAAVGRELAVPSDSVPDAKGYDEVRPPEAASRPGAADPGLSFDAMPLGSRDERQPAPGQGAGAAAEPAAAPLSDRQAFIAMARKAAEKAKADADASTQQDKSGKSRGARPPVAALPGAAVPKAAVGGVRPAILAVAGLALVMLGGYWYLAGPKLRLPFGLSQTERVVSEEAPQPARRIAPRPKDGSAPPKAPGQAGPRAEAPAGSQPDIEEEAPAPRSRSAGPSRTSSDDADAISERSTLEEARTDRAPSASAGPGIAVAMSDSVNVQHVMQARERARLAELSERTAGAAARAHGVRAQTGAASSDIATFSVPEARAAAAPAPQHVQHQPEEPAKQLVLPPAAAGPLSLRLAAAQGDPSAQLEIATRLAEGKGIKQSFAEAATWFNRAAEQGVAVAQYRLAALYEWGKGVKADREAAKEWYRRAAAQGNVKSMHNLAVMLASPAGKGNPDYAEAASLFSTAAARGLADSQYNLGILYESGLGVPKDHAAAYKWYSLAAKGGDQDAGRRRDLLIARLSPETIEATDAQLVGWRPEATDASANDARVAGEAWKRHATTGSAINR
ncbi:MAG: hypothetical protein AB7O57_10875 [Hyphomicrobiaceae bacterium]